MNGNTFKPAIKAINVTISYNTPGGTFSWTTTVSLYSRFHIDQLIYVEDLYQMSPIVRTFSYNDTQLGLFFDYKNGRLKTISLINGSTGELDITSNDITGSFNGVNNVNIVTVMRDLALSQTISHVYLMTFQIVSDQITEDICTIVYQNDDDTIYYAKSNGQGDSEIEDNTLCLTDLNKNLTMTPRKKELHKYVPIKYPVNVHLYRHSLNIHSYISQCFPTISYTTHGSCIFDIYNNSPDKITGFIDFTGSQPSPNSNFYLFGNGITINENSVVGMYKWSIIKVSSSPVSYDTNIYNFSNDPSLYIQSVSRGAITDITIDSDSIVQIL